MDWAAHLGGLVTGILVGVPIFAMHIESKIWRALWVILGVGLLIMSFIWSLTYMYSGAIEPAEELSDICGKCLACLSTLLLEVFLNESSPHHIMPRTHVKGYYKEFFEDYECTCVRG